LKRKKQARENLVISSSLNYFFSINAIEGGGRELGDSGINSCCRRGWKRTTLVGLLKAHGEARKVIVEALHGENGVVGWNISWVSPLACYWCLKWWLTAVTWRNTKKLLFS